MARVSLLGRIMLVLLGALSLLVVATFGIDQWQRSQEQSPYTTRFPRLDQAAGIIALVKGADPAQRPAILHAVNGEALRAEIVDAPPDETALIREPVLEARLHRRTADAGGDIRAFTAADLLYKAGASMDAGAGQHRKAIGSLAMATYRLPDGHILVISAILGHHSLMPWLLGQPLSLWVAVLGLAVAAIVTLGMRHELGPLRRLTESVSHFDGRRSEPALVDRGAPEIRQLAQAVQAMQERIVGLMGERSTLIGAISHDLKTYLTRMRLRAERVAELEPRDRLLEDLDAMTALIDTSLGFARGTASEIGRTPVDLADIVAVEVAEHAAQGASITLSGEEVSDATVAGDAVALRRVVANLIGNAVKFGRTSVAVVVRRGRGDCEIIVEDDGPGIPVDERSAVFSPYYRIEPSRNRRTGGIGLGLAIARQIAEAHGGTIVAEGSASGGARFVVRLPALA